MAAGDLPPSRPTWRDLHQEALERLGAPMEVRWLVEEASGGAWPAVLDERPGLRARSRFAEMVARRAGGEPLQYVLGRWAFRTLDLLVDRRVLIPRPETEQVVDVALAELDRQLGPVDMPGSDAGGLGPVDTPRGDPGYGESRQPGRAPVVVDLGTGSGAIALAIAAERPCALVWATDAAPSALEVAAANLAGLGGRAATRVRLVEGEWWMALPSELAGQVDLAVANPPYIAAGEVAQLDPVVVEWEPMDALVSGRSGLEGVEQVVAGAPRWLRAGGSLVVEIAPHQAETAVGLAEAAGLVAARVAPDLAGRPRALVARRPAPAEAAGPDDGVLG